MYKRLVTAGLALTLLLAPVFHFFQPAYAAAGLPNRSITIGNSRASAVTTYDFQFDLTVGGTLGSIRFEFCSNDPLPFELCTIPSGFDISGAVIDGQSGETGFTVHGSTNPNNLILTRVPLALTPQTVSYDTSNVVNPDVGPATYYIRVYTYAADDGTGPTTEEGGLAFAITDDFGVTAFVPPFLEFCVGITITSNSCATASGDSINFGTLTPDSVRTATSQMTAGTNGVGGVSIAVIGTTMTSGVHTIDALNAPSPSSPGVNQFGINLRNNASPNVGANPTGIGTTVPVGNYNIPNQFTFNTGDQIANSPLSTNFNTLTASYIVNVHEDQNPGVYTSTITYVATATF